MTVRFTKEAVQQLERIPVALYDRLLALFARLEKWPQVSGAKPLRGKLAGCYRLRTGDYRVQFYIVGETVWVDKLGHRDGFYED